VGNRLSVTYPNGAVCNHTYDHLNRLTYLENRNADGSIISSYAYTLNSAGLRTKVVEHSGRTVHYAYDDLHRLTGEEILDPVLGYNLISYSYDAFGNRLTKSDADGTITYTYDANDRLLSENGPTGLTTYIYDANGNTLRKDGPEPVDYAYDDDNRLISVATAVETATYA
jgi:YD repeat-containing protein